MSETKKSFVDAFLEKVQDKKNGLKELLEFLGTPIDPSCETPEEYSQCIDLIKEYRPNDAQTLDDWVKEWNDYLSQYG